MASQETCVVHTFPFRLQNQRQLLSRYTVISIGNTLCISEFVNRVIPTAGSCRVLSLMKIINVLKVTVWPIRYLILSKLLKSSPDHRCIYTRENNLLHRNQRNITCALHIVTFNKSSSNAKTDSLWRLKNWSCYCTDVSFHFDFLRVFFRSDTNCYSKAKYYFA